MTSAQATIAYVGSEGTRTAYRMVGNGPLLVLIHGAEGDHAMFFGLMDQLSSEFRVVAYDQRDSGSTTNSSSPYSIEDLADDAGNLIAALSGESKPRAHVFGTSYGGQIAQVLASRHPRYVDQLVLASTWRDGRPITDVNARAIQELGRLRGDAHANAIEIASYFCSPGYPQSHPEVLDWFRSSSRTEAQRQRRMGAMIPVEIDHKRIDMPTLLVAGSGDRLVPSTATFEIAQVVPHACILELNDMPHLGVIESPGLIAAPVADFFASAGRCGSQPRDRFEKS